MNNNRHFDALIVVTPDDCKRLMQLYPRLVDNFSYGKICFIGSAGVGEIALKDPAIGDMVKWVDENDIIPFSDVHGCMTNHLKDMLKGEPLPRGITGWYYQQFLKMQYSAFCQDEYYMVWDGDTVPCRPIKMFSDDTGKPYLDLKHEYHPEYFETLGKILPGMKKVIERSFISEHMLMKKDIMQSLIRDIEANDNIPGDKFWEKIINCIEPEKIYDSSFSEFETYGTYVALKYSSLYRLREWHSFRLGGSFFKIDTICDRDFIWLGKDFDAISFEKGQEGTGENYHFFDNPEYQQKLSAKKMLQIAQMEYRDGYKEIWGDDLSVDKNANVRVGGYHTGKKEIKNTLIVVVSYNGLFFMQANIQSIRETLTPGTYKIVVVDNASTDGVTQWLDEQKDILLIKNTENVGFGPACNQAVAATVGTEYADWDVFLLNNDTRMVFDALYYLKKALYSSDDIGAVGSVSNYAGNKQALDVEFDKVEDYIAYGEKINVPMKDALLERVRLCGFAMLVRRKVWDDVGGFDEDFVPGYYEDDALSMEILRQGYRLEVVRNSFIYHAGSESFVKTDYNSAVQRNYKLFIKKYGFDIMKYAYANGTVISAIPYGKEERFSVLHYGCGLGAELKAIHSLYPNSEGVGIEFDEKILEIASHTEKIYGSVGQLKEAFPEQKFNVLIIEKKDLETLNDETKCGITEMLVENPIVLLKDWEYEDIEYERVKQIIWNVDTIDPSDYSELIWNITDHGIINSMLTSGDVTKARERLKDSRLDELFVFDNPNSDISDILDLKPENVLSVSKAEIIPYLKTYCTRTVARDLEHRELTRCRIFEKKLQERVMFSSEQAFLEASDIKITINRNCLEELDSIYNLVVQGRQMSVGQKWAEKEILTKLCTNNWNDNGYIRVEDKYGDYGISGFFCYNRREKLMEYFVFSKDIGGMGIAQYIFNILGCNKESLDKEWKDKLRDNVDVSWIWEDKEKEILKDSLKARRVNIFLKGKRFAEKVEPYLAGGNITIEHDNDMEDTKLFVGEYKVVCMEYAPQIVVTQSGDVDYDKVFEELENFEQNIKGNPCIILLLTDEYKEINPVVEEFAADSGHIRTIYTNAADASEYYDLAGKICEYINDAI